MNRPEVVILIGLPGSGKSSFYRARFAQTHVHISKDNWPNYRRREERQKRELSAALQQGQDVIVDNTSASREHRASIIAVAREYQARVVGYVFAPNLADCLARNASRTGRARVPDVALYATLDRWQAPMLDEGFAKLYQVHLRDGDFEIGGEQSDEPRPI